MKESLKYNTLSTILTVMGLLTTWAINDPVGIILFGSGFIANMIMYAVILRRKK